MRIVKVRLGRRGYDIRIGRDLLGQVGIWLRRCCPPDKAVIITNPIVDRLYGDYTQAVAGQGRVSNPHCCWSRKAKSISRWIPPPNSMRACRRSTPSGTTPMLALGGGVIGDLAGFVAATYMRGLPAGTAAHHPAGAG